MKIDRNSPIPAYFQIFEDLLNRITQNEWKIGEILPSELALMDHYDVSRITVRLAFEELRKKDLVSRQRGKGTFLISIPKAVELDFSFPTEINEKLSQDGLVLTAKILNFEYMETVPKSLAEHLGISTNDPVIYIERLYSSNHLPYSLNCAWVPLSFVPDILEQGLIGTSLSKTLKDRYHIITKSSDNWVEAMNASKKESELLDVPSGEVILLLTTIQQDNHSKIYEYSKSYWKRDRIRFHFINEHK